MLYFEKKGNKLPIIGTILLLIVNYKFFYLVSLPGTYGAPTNEILYTSLSILIFGALIISCNLKLYKFNFLTFILLLYLLLLIELFFTLFKYPDEPISNSFRALFPFFSLLSYFVYSIFSQCYFHAFIKTIITFSSIIGLICIVELILYTKYGISLFKIFGFNYGLTADQAVSINYLRNGRFRLIVSNLLELSSIVSISYLLFFKKTSSSFKAFLVLNIFISVIYTFFVSQIRSVTFYIIFVFIFVCLISKKINNSLVLYASLIISLLLILIFLFLFKEKLIITINSQYSLYHRIDEIEFYLKRFINSPIFGNGLIVDNKSLYNSQVVIGYDYFAPFAYNDVGIIGILGEFGLIGIIMIIALLSKMISLFRKENNIIILAIVIITALCFINLSLLDAERLPVLAVYMAVIDGATQFKSRKKEN